MYDLKSGDKVKYVGCDGEQIRWGGHADPRGILEESATYTIQRISVCSQHTKIYLAGFSGHFNSACFRKV